MQSLEMEPISIDLPLLAQNFNSAIFTAQLQPNTKFVSPHD